MLALPVAFISITKRNLLHFTRSQLYRRIAREAAEQSMVLLINKQIDGAPALPLPLTQNDKRNGNLKVLLAGPLIDDPLAQNGGYSHTGLVWFGLCVDQHQIDR